jgi:hypothetical protein
MTPDASRKPRRFPWRPGLFLGFGVLGGALAGVVVASRILALDPWVAQAGGGERTVLVLDLAGLYGLLGALAGGLLALLWFVAGHLAGRRPRRSPQTARAGRRAAIALAAAICGVALATIFGRGKAVQPAAVAPPPESVAGGSGDEPPPVVLLLIDGADLDDMILPMVEAGELPGFRRLMESGTWGPLASERPTLSPILWTTIATGKPASEHGIHDFVYFRFPGFDRPVYRLPRASGLRFHLFPLLERIPGLGFRRAPYTSDLRRSRALWEIAGERHPVGVYRWLITWPAEAVHGFMVSGGLYAGPGGWHPQARDWLQDLRGTSPGALDALGRHPADLEVTRPQQRPRLGRLTSYLRPGEPIDRADGDVKLIRRSLRDPTIYELPALMAKYRPKLTAAAFYTVDSFQHHFNQDRRDGGVFEGAIAERYRFTDRMLRRFQTSLEPRTNLIVISDHGYDFDLDHHWQAPAGVFFARGPAFARGRRIESMTIADVVPLCLYVLGLPPAEDMPGTLSGTYRDAVSSRYAERHPPSTIPTWERGPRQRSDVEAALDDELRRSLEALGYL